MVESLQGNVGPFSGFQTDAGGSSGHEISLPNAGPSLLLVWMCCWRSFTLTVTGLTFPLLTHGKKGRQREGHFPAGIEHKLHERKEGEEALEKCACGVRKNKFAVLGK